MGYRDDKEAVGEQLAELEGALANLDQERERLATQAASLRALRGSTPPTAAAAAAPVAESALGRGSLWLLALGAVGFGFLAVAATRGVESAPARPVEPFADVPGAPAAVNPLALLDRAQQRAGATSELTAIEAWYVSSDGTMNLTAPAYRAQVAFHFAGPEPAAPSAPSILGAPRPYAPPPPVWCFAADRSGFDICTTSHGQSRVPRPTCSTAAVWAAARAVGAPSEAVAKLTYKESLFPREPVWTFEISGTTWNLEVIEPGCTAVKPGERLFRKRTR